MFSLFLRNHLAKVCALAATILILPALAFASGSDNQGPNGQGPNGQGQNVPVVPEANPVWVLVPFFGAVLLFSSRHLFGRKAHKHNG
jgi:hypothetical protein